MTGSCQTVVNTILGFPGMPIFQHPAIRSHIEAYGRSHSNPVNQALHIIGIPAAATAVLGLLAKLTAPEWELAGAAPDAAWVALAIAAIWYLWADWKGGIVPLVALAVCYAAGRCLPVWMSGAFLATAALLHLIGHYGFEGKPPALLSRPVAVLEAPA